MVFSGGNCTCRYSQTIIKDVPYGTKVHTDGAYIEINGVGVTVMATPTEGEALLHNYTFDRWSANDGEYIFSDTVISAYFNVTDKLFNLKFEAVGGGMLLDCSKGTTDYSFNFYDGKAYSAYVDGGETGQPVSEKFTLVTTINGERITYYFGPWSPYEDFYTYVFDGWYYNGETLKYGVDLTGDVLIEGHFHQEQLDYTYLFDFEINTATNDAAIVGVKEEYLNTQLDHLTIPRSYQGYPVAGIKNAALSNLSINHLAIPNTLIYIEEVESFSSSIIILHLLFAKQRSRTGFGYFYIEKFADIVCIALERNESATLRSAANHTLMFACKVFAENSINAAYIVAGYLFRYAVL